MVLSARHCALCVSSDLAIARAVEGLAGLELRVGGARIGDEPSLVSWRVNGRLALAARRCTPGWGLGACGRRLSFFGEPCPGDHFRLRVAFAGTQSATGGSLKADTASKSRPRPWITADEVESP